MPPTKNASKGPPKATRSTSERSKSLKNRHFWFAVQTPELKKLKSLIKKHGGQVQDDYTEHTIPIVDVNQLPDPREHHGIDDWYLPSLVQALIDAKGQLDSEDYASHLSDFTTARASEREEAQAAQPVRVPHHENMESEEEGHLHDESAFEERTEPLPHADYVVQEEQATIDPAALNTHDEPETEPLAVAPVAAPTNHKKRKEPTLYKPQRPEEMSPEELEWIQQEEDAFIEANYMRPELKEDRSIIRKMVGENYLRTAKRIPPHITATEADVKPAIKTVNRAFQDTFLRPPLALSDAPRAAEPVTANYMPSENFAMLIWYTRCIPYYDILGQPASWIVWNWARTHSLVQRTQQSMHEHFKVAISKIIKGDVPIPAGTFQRELAKTKFFYFNGDKIAGVNILAVKQKNKACVEKDHLDPLYDHFCNISTLDTEKNAALLTKLRATAGFHDGSRWLAE